MQKAPDNIYWTDNSALLHYYFEFLLSIFHSPNVAKLKALCENVETLKAERQAIEAEIKSTNPDMKNIFLSTHAGHDVINEEEMSKETLNRAFSGLIEQVFGIFCY